MSMLTTHFSNLCMTPAIVKKLLGFKVNPYDTLSSSSSNTTTQSNLSLANGSTPLPPSSSTSGGESSMMSPTNSTSALLSNSNSNAILNHNKLCEKAIRALVKKLKKTPGALEELERAITTRDSNTKCILLPTKLNPQERMQVSRKTLPHVVYCRIWRWADLQNCNELKSVSHCQQGYNHATANNNSNTSKSKTNGMEIDSPVVCINPYHYTRCCDTTSSSHHNHNHHQSETSNNPSLLTVYVPTKLTSTSASTITTTLIKTNELAPISAPSSLFASLTNSILPSCQATTTSIQPPTSTLQTPVTLSNGSSLSSSSSSSSSSSILQNDITHQQLSTTGELIHSSNYMITASPSPVSILSPSSIASNAISQFSPFISEDDSSEINDISPSPIGPCDLMPVTMIEQPYWCSLSYYEMKQRVGEMFHVASDVHSVTIDGYTDPSSAQRFCLGVLSNVNRTNEIEMTRHYIGRGLMLSYENGQVFAECLSENPVFVQSPNCNQRYHWHLATVVKIPPGCSLKIFDEADFVQLANETVYQGFEAVYALTRICTIRISFVKGWGAEYRRQTILNTPCWIEVHLNNPLKLVDQILTKMGSPRTKCTSFS